MWGRLHGIGIRYLQRTRNSATRLSDPHDLTHREDTTMRRVRAEMTSCESSAMEKREIVCVIDGKGSGKSRKTIDIPTIV